MNLVKNNRAPQVLIADDHPNIRSIVRFALEKEGMSVVEVGDGVQALQLLKSRNFDLVVLDVMMPELDGFSVCRKVREANHVPILFLSSRDEEFDRILGLELGGDDYMAKPFSPRELILRCHAILKRVLGKKDQPLKHSDESSRMAVGQYHLDCDQYLFGTEMKYCPLTMTEFKIVKAIMQHPKKVFTRDELLDLAYGHAVVVTDRTIDTHIRRLRKKLHEIALDPIETVHGIGYRLKT
jgi:two-component system OmpR family response regulator